MELKALGCHSSRFPGNHLCSFLINGSFVLDAGGIVSTLTLDEQIKIKHILITHSHLDHVKDIAFIADNIRHRGGAVDIISIKAVLNLISAHLLNNKLWPDFTKIPDPASPVLKYHPIPLNSPVEIDGLTIRAVKVNHVVPTVAYFVSDEKATVLFTSDMGPSYEIWEEANRVENLKAVFIDVTFPNAMQNIADLSKHLTPQKLKEELKKLKSSAAVYAYHIKAQHEKEIVKEMAKCCPAVRAVNEGEVMIISG